MISRASHLTDSPWQATGGAAEYDHFTPKWPLPLRAAVVLGLSLASWAPIVLLLA